MKKSVLILTSPGDLHTFAVAAALRRKGAEVILWHTTDFPTRSAECFVFEAGSTSALIEGLGRFDGPGPTTVWRRRPAHAIDRAKLHPEDVDFANLECSIFRRSFLTAIFPQAFWVNPPDAAIRANQKLIQHRAALATGWKAPDTLYGNDPEVIRSFIERHQGRSVYKTLQGLTSQSGEGWFPFTRLLTAEDLVADDLIRATPGIYQEVVPKAYELRITTMGRTAFAVRILSQETELGRVDWRQSESGVQMEPHVLDPQMQARCVDLLAKLGIVFGCIDVIVTPENEAVFLEVNEMGQFLFLEQRVGLPLLDAFSDFLLQGTFDFHWRPAKAPIWYSDVAQEAEAETAESVRHHGLPQS